MQAFNQVTLPDHFVVILAGGMIHEVGIDCAFTALAGEVIVSTPFEMSCTISADGSSVGSLKGAKAVTFHLSCPATLTFQTSPASASLEQLIVDLFHDEGLNPAAGALSLEEISLCLKSTENEVMNALMNERIFRTYRSRVGALSVVLNCSVKRPKSNIGCENDLLLGEIMKNLTGGMKTVNTLFNEIRTHPEYSRRLVAGFTTLKKFLAKNNREIIWFQEEKSTKVKKRFLIEG